MKRIFTIFSLVLALIIVSTTCAFAGEKLPSLKALEGVWATIGMRSCVQAYSLNGFGSGPQFQLTSGGSARVMQEAGTLSLFGDGTGSWSGKAVQINYTLTAGGSYPVSGFTQECDVTYEPWPDGTIKFKFDNCVSVVTVGQYPDAQSGKYHYTAEFAQLSADGITMVFWDLEPIVERIWLTISGVTTDSDRICSRTGTAIKFR